MFEYTIPNMQRGVITTSPAAIGQLLQFLQTENISDQSLIDRLSGLVNSSQSNVDLQISGDEAELFLDVLPPPNSAENTDLIQLRHALQEFLNESA